MTLKEKIELLKVLSDLSVINPYGGTLALVEKMIKEILDTITIS